MKEHLILTVVGHFDDTIGKTEKEFSILLMLMRLFYFLLFFLVAYGFVY